MLLTGEEGLFHVMCEAKQGDLTVRQLRLIKDLLELDGDDAWVMVSSCPEFYCVISAEIKVTMCNENACRDKPKHKYIHKSTNAIQQNLQKINWNCQRNSSHQNNNVVVVPNPYAVYFSVEHKRLVFFPLIFSNDSLLWSHLLCS